MITYEQAAAWTGGEWLRRPPGFQEMLRGGALDTRRLGTAQLFFALRGAGGDGHRYLPRLAESGVRLAVVSQAEAPWGGFGGAVLCVADVPAALAALARELVALCRPRVVAITGSYGKTTTKEIIARVLQAGWCVLHNRGSLNNELGIPLTLLELTPRTEVLVLEYSARKPGDIAWLCGIARPQVGVLTGVGNAHIGVFGSQEAILRTKGELFAHLAADGLAIYPAGDARLAALAAGRRSVSFGPGGDYRAEQLQADAEGRLRFEAVRGIAVRGAAAGGEERGAAAGEGGERGAAAEEGEERGEVRLRMHSPLLGPHGAQPVLAAWAVARELGRPPEAQVAQRVAPAAGAPLALPGRLQPCRSRGGAFILDDSYNASAETVLNLAGALALRAEAQKVLLLGPLSELEPGWVRTAVQVAACLRAPLTACLVYDPLGNGLGPALQRAHAAAGERLPLRVLRSWEALLTALAPWDTPETAFGVKGARSAHMERVVLALQGREVGCRRQPCALLARCSACAWLEGGAPE